MMASLTIAKPVNRTRRFELPSIQDLNKEQDAALALPLEGQHLIIGGPGTGKSVMALLRAGRLAKEMGNKRYRFLAYNRLLDQSSRHLFGDPPLTSRTLESWFRDVWDQLQVPLPILQPRPGSTFRDIDWPGIEHFIIDSNNYVPLSERYKSPLPFLVIDEGQDMPKAFYFTLASLGFENFFVVADQNQQIHPNKCSSRQEIEDALGIEPGETLELRTNYRNTHPTALLARHFYTGDPASPPPELPDRKPSALRPELWRYGDQGTLDLEEIAGRILQMADRDPRKLIGIITPNNRIRQKFLGAFERAMPTLDNGRPPIQTYSSGMQDNLDFSTGGVMVINAQSCKGLEFEVAILADLDDHQPRQDEVALRKRFYVMVTRARDQVILLRCGVPQPAIDSLLPDSSILDRKVQNDGLSDEDIPY